MDALRRFASTVLPARESLVQLHGIAPATMHAPAEPGECGLDAVVMAEMAVVTAIAAPATTARSRG
jgi:hypothetical protein